jgi:hypothetical protein
MKEIQFNSFGVLAKKLELGNVWDSIADTIENDNKDSKEYKEAKEIFKSLTDTLSDLVENDNPVILSNDDYNYMIDNISELLQISPPIIMGKPEHYPCKMKYFLVQVKELNLLFLTFSYLFVSESCYIDIDIDKMLGSGKVEWSHFDVITENFIHEKVNEVMSKYSQEFKDESST